MRNVVSKLLLASILTISCFHTALAAPVDVNEIFKSTKGWTDAPLPGFQSGQPEMRVVSFKIEPGAKTSVHVHPVNGAGYVISGELTMYSSETPNGDFSDPKKVKKVILKAGDAWAESVNVWHYGENNGDKDANFIVVFSGTPGTPSTLSRP